MMGMTWDHNMSFQIFLVVPQPCFMPPPSTRLTATGWHLPSRPFPLTWQLM